jgi:hypothetical protein
MRHDRRNEAGEMNGVMLKGVDVRLLSLKLLWMINQQELSKVARDNDVDARIWLLPRSIPEPGRRGSISHLSV